MTARSMTGFGAASREAAGFSVRVEIRSVNNRGLNVNVRAPSLLDAHTAAVEAAVRRHVARGTVSVSISLSRARTAAPSWIARAVVADYAAQALSTAADLQLVPPTLGDLLRLPGALEEAPAAEISADELALVLGTVDDAAAEVVVEDADVRHAHGLPQPLLALPQRLHGP